jgi:hypothetical protein
MARLENNQADLESLRAAFLAQNVQILRQKGLAAEYIAELLDYPCYIGP